MKLGEIYTQQIKLTALADLLSFRLAMFFYWSLIPWKNFQEILNRQL